MKDTSIISLVRKYFNFYGFSADVMKTGSPKTPDFIVSKDDVSFYCEVKSPQLKQNDQTGMFH